MFRVGLYAWVSTHDQQTLPLQMRAVREYAVKLGWAAPIGHSRHEPVSSRLPSRLVSWASAPEFGELLGKGSALVVTGSSGGRTPRRIHHIDANAECVLRVVIREDGFDPAAACA